MQYTDRHNVSASWRNINTPAYKGLDELLRDAVIFNETLFSLIYGPSVYRYRSADNSIRVCTFFRRYELKPIIKSRAVERREPVHKGDILAIIDGDETLFGKVTFVSRSDDEAGVFMFLKRELDRIDLSLFETARGMGKVKWRIQR